MGGSDGSRAFSALSADGVWASDTRGSTRLSDTKADGNVGYKGFSDTTNSARSSNGYNGGKVWTRMCWLARSAMFSVAVEKIGGLFF